MAGFRPRAPRSCPAQWEGERVRPFARYRLLHEPGQHKPKKKNKKEKASAQLLKSLHDASLLSNVDHIQGKPGAPGCKTVGGVNDV